MRLEVDADKTFRPVVAEANAMINIAIVFPFVVEVAAHIEHQSNVADLQIVCAKYSNTKIIRGRMYFIV